MKNYYSTIDKVIMTFSNINITKDGFENIFVRFERPNDTGFDYSEWKLPCISNTRTYGFSEDEIMNQERYLRNNSVLIWEIARDAEDDKVA